MSVRKDILDAVVAALATIDGIGLVSTKLKTIEQLRPQDFPALFPIDGDAEYTRLAYKHDTAADMECELEIIVTGAVYDNLGDLDAARTELIADVETTLTGNAALALLVQSVTPVSIGTDAGIKERYSAFDFRFQIVYSYNHNTP